MADIYSHKAQSDSCNFDLCQCIPSSSVSCLVKQKQRDHHSEESTLRYFDMAINKCALSLDKSAIQQHKLQWLEVIRENQQQPVIAMHLDSSNNAPHGMLAHRSSWPSSHVAGSR